MKRQAWIGTSIGLVATTIVTWIFRSTTLDIDLQALFFGDAVARSWPHADRPHWKLLHDFGTIPGLLFALCAVAAATASFINPRFLLWRYPALYVVVLTALGPGLVT